MIALFPGQGSQEVGMAKDLFDNFSIVRELFEEGSDAIKTDLKKLCFEGPETDLKLTENTQPCLLLASTAAFRVAKNEIGFQPTIAAGHSLGEYSALVASEAVEFETAIQWVRQRGKAMQEAVPAGKGGMLAIMGPEDDDVRTFCENVENEAKKSNPDAVLSPANFNAPGQVVVAGSADAVGIAEKMMADGKFSGKCIPLQVSAPFHCKMMKPAREKMAKVFESTPQEKHPKNPKFPYVPNCTARQTSEPGVILEFLVKQIDHPVLWTQTITGLLENSEKAVEFGPGKVLQGLGKRISRKIKKPLTTISVGSPDGIKELEKNVG